MKKSKSQKSEKFTVVLDDSAWSRYLLKSDPKALRDDFESNDNSAVSAINFLAACEAEARRVLESNPLPSGPQGYIRTDPSHIKYLSDYGNLERLSRAQRNAVEILRTTFSLGCLIARAPWEKRYFLDHDGAGRIVLETMQLTAALIRGNFFETLFPKIEAAERRNYTFNAEKIRRGKETQRLISQLAASFKRRPKAEQVRRKWIRRTQGDKEAQRNVLSVRQIMRYMKNIPKKAAI